MKELDDKIRAALRQEDAEVFDDWGGEPSMFTLVMDTFRGRHKWLVLLTVVWSLVFFALAIYSAFKFFNTEDAREVMLWAVAFIFCMSAVSMLKLWFWMEINKNAILREIKRVELQIARLAGRIKD